MIDNQLKNVISIGFISFLFLLGLQVALLVTDKTNFLNSTLLFLSSVTLGAGLLISLYVYRLVRDRETACHVESAKAKNANSKLRWQASHDSLTRLVNRREFRRRCVQACNAAKKSGRRHVVAQINLDRFKTVNDHCGHRAGDTLLSQLPSLLKTLLREEDTLARISGDEFAVLLPDSEMKRGTDIAEAMRKVIRQYRFPWDGHFFEIGASIGVVPINQDYCHLQEVLTAADTACQEAKTAGRNRVCVLESSDQLLAKRQGNVRCAQELPRAIRQNRMQLFGQEICSIKDDEPGHHYELLVRLNLENGQQMKPDQFIPVAEQYGLAADLDRWVIHEALGWLSEQNQMLKVCSLGDEIGGVNRLSINLSGQSISDESFLTDVMRMMEEATVNPEQLIFEITETTAVTNLHAAQKFIGDFRTRGCKFALDDFGSGMSSFGYLQKLDVDYVKIDGSLVSQVAKGGLESAMINAIVHIAHHMGAKTIAEYVEDPLTQNILESAGVDYIQGFLIHKPAPLDRIGHTISAFEKNQIQLALAV